MLAALAQWDASVLLWIQENVRCGLLSAILVPWSKLGNAGFIWILLSVLLLLIPKTRKAGTAALLAMLLSLIFTNGIIKHLAARQRPWLVVEGLVPLLAEPDPNSFPSGHTAAAMACAVAWLKTLPVRWGRVLAMVGAVLMGLSRLYVGVHFPTDVLVGAVLGAVYACVVLALIAWWEREKTQSFPQE